MLRTLIIFLLTALIAFPAYSNTDIERDEKGWTSWVSLGGDVYSDPAACTAGNWTIVAVRGADSQIWYRKRYLPTGNWTAWKRMPVLYSGGIYVSATGAPSLACYHTNTYDSFQLYVNTNNQRVWSIVAIVKDPTDKFYQWYKDTDFNSALYSGPAIAVRGTNPAYLYTRGGDNRIYEQKSANPFQVLISEQSFNDPTAVWTTPDRLDFFYRDQFGKLWQMYKIGNIWSNRALIPGATYSSPEVTSLNNQTINLFAKGYNNTLIYKRSFNNVWSEWENLGGQITSGPGVAVYANSTRLMVFARWTDGTLRYKAWAP